MDKQDTTKNPPLRAQEVPKAKQCRITGTRRGRFTPAYPEKYEGKLWVDTPQGRQSNIFYRSKIELRLLKYLDSHPSVVKWSSEEIIIPYVSPIDGHVHRYYVDFKATVRKKDGSEKTYLIEVKWSTATVAPKVPKKKTRRYLNEVRTWEINKAKWEEAKKVCKKKGWEWLVITEKQLTF